MIICKGRLELQKMREANLIVAEVLAHLETLLKAGVTTAQLDAVTEEMIVKRNGEPAFKGYQGYPAALCASVNEQIVHGIPNNRPLQDGDIVALDVGVYYKGFYGDSARTFPVGDISEELKLLLKVTHESLYRGIERVKVGNRVSDISHSIQEHVEAPRVFGSPRVCGARNREGVTRGTAGAQLWDSGPRSEVAGRDGSGHRADGQQPGSGGQAFGGQMDRRDG